VGGVASGALTPPESALLECAPQPPQRVVRARLDRAERHAEPLGDLGQLEVLVVDELEHLPVGGRERRHRVADGHGEQHLVGRRLDRALVAELRAEGPGRRAAPQVGGDPPGDREEQRADRPPGRVEPRGRLPQPHPGLLHELLGEDRLAEQMKAESVQAPLVASIQPAERHPGVTGGHEGEQLGVGGGRGIEHGWD
jgi:hypothetical protein